MSVESCQGVGKKFQRCREKASKMSGESFKGVVESFKGVGRKFQRCRGKASKMSGESFKGVGRKLQRCLEKA